MKSLQYFVALTMIVGLTGNPVKAADTERAHAGDRMQPMKLSAAQMDEITAGRVDQESIEKTTIILGHLLEAGIISESGYNQIIDTIWSSN